MVTCARVYMFVIMAGYYFFREINYPLDNILRML